MRYVAYSFGAKSIQTYILATNKLKDRIGGSLQIESLCSEGGKLDQVLNKLDIHGENGEIQFARKAGGVFVAVFDSETIENPLYQAKRLQALWTFTIQELMPGLRFNQGIGEGDQISEAVNLAYKQQRINQQQIYPELPLAGPLAEYSPRSGKAAVVSKTFNSGDTELLDKATSLKRNLQQDIKAGREKDLLTEKFALIDTDLNWPFIMPEDEESKEANEEDIFPLNPEDKTIAILHADINSLGEISLNFTKELEGGSYIKDTKSFTEAVRESVEKAAAKAVLFLAEGLEEDKTPKVMPARPLVLAGDDITFILRGDVALDFSRIFLEELEQCSKIELQALRNKKNLPDHLTACAGIAYIKSSQPFYQGYKLSESLCEWAKRESKKRKKENNLEMIPSSIAFHRITTSMIEEYSEVVSRELTTENQVVLSHQPYFLGNNHEIPRLDDLASLSKELEPENISHSQLRPLLNLLYEGDKLANKSFERWREVMEKRNKSSSRDHIVDYLQKLTGNGEKDVKFSALKQARLDDQNNTFWCTPLADAITLTRVNHPTREAN